MTVLKGMAWSHQRGVGCLRAVSDAYARRTPGVRITWDARSLRDFEDVPIAALAAEYDLIAMDHPYVGQAHAAAALVPLDTVLPAAVLAEQRRDAVGPGYDGYTWAGGQWAAAMDVAAQVSAYRPDLLAGIGVDAPPRSWDGVLDLLASLPPGLRAVLPANPTHLLASLLTLCAQQAGGAAGWLGPRGLDPEVAVPAAERLLALLDLVDPVSLRTDPIGALESMSAGTAVCYAPIVFGYVNYARPDHPGAAVRFADIPSPDGAPAGSLLGGVGLAVSAASTGVAAAAEFVAHVAGADCQRGEYVRAGGQPGSRTAWTDPEADAACGGFFGATLATVDRAYVRPRDPVYPVVHRRGGAAVHELVRQRAEPAAVVRRFNEVCAALYADAGR
ncbi:carbohydrate ABC transporter substrate-binding protein (CUT1 family) [Murinocardiopsis flavida]|uniref:Carbohydrate ABC transporter substrate-binding protein (CUT1 family) n=1 Tax=Murinocardiopsis flavida TaxID=645275 RepID=A0A2P8DGC5_9ACTN|nr:ABC transporter substrate-binding protein [Murinocardiopsis flavida]PSK96272.1 carbohydrate ABC transporter substrate-binding protein (CUT1 family) [Murinocardiopsis flavida]